MPKIRIRTNTDLSGLLRGAPPLSPHSPLTRAILGIWTWLLASRHDTLSEQNLSGDICKHCTKMSFLFDSWILACPRNVNSLNSISSSHHARLNYTCIHQSINYYESLCPQKGVLGKMTPGVFPAACPGHRRVFTTGSGAPMLHPGRRRSADSEYVSLRNQGGKTL